MKPVVTAWSSEMAQHGAQRWLAHMHACMHVCLDFLLQLLELCSPGLQGLGLSPPEYQNVIIGLIIIGLSPEYQNVIIGLIIIGLSPPE